MAMRTRQPQRVESAWQRCTLIPGSVVTSLSDVFAQNPKLGTEHRIPLSIELKHGDAAIPEDGSFGVPSVCASKADALAAIQRLVEMVQLSQFCGENPEAVAEIIHAGLPVDDDEAIPIVDSIRANLVERAGE